MWSDWNNLPTWNMNPLLVLQGAVAKLLLLLTSCIILLKLLLWSFCKRFIFNYLENISLLVPKYLGNLFKFCSGTLSKSVASFLVIILLYILTNNYKYKSEFVPIVKKITKNGIEKHICCLSDWKNALYFKTLSNPLKKDILQLKY